MFRDKKTDSNASAVPLKDIVAFETLGPDPKLLNYIKLAHIFYRMLIIGLNPPEPMIFFPSKSYSPRCRFDEDTKRAPHLLHLINIEKIKTKNTQGLATSILIAYFLRMKLNHEKIIYSQKLRGFTNLNLETAFNQFWLSGNKISDANSFFNFHNLFAGFNFKLIFSANYHQDLQNLVADNQFFWEEAYTFILHVILFPLDQIANLNLLGTTEKDSFIYATLKQTQLNFLLSAFAEPSFIEFVLSIDVTQQATDFFKHLVTVINQFTDNPVTQSQLQLLNQAILENAENFTSRGKLTAFALIHPQVPKEFKKIFALEIIAQQKSVAMVFAIVKELEKPKYILLRNREANYEVSIHGSAIKTDEGIQCVCKSFNEIRKAAKDKMLELGIQDNFKELTENSAYRDFLMTHLDGYWFGFETILKYVKNTASFEILEPYLDEMKALELKKNPVEQIKIAMQEAVIQGFRDGISDLSMRVQGQLLDWKSQLQHTLLGSKTAEVELSDTKDWKSYRLNRSQN